MLSPFRPLKQKACHQYLITGFLVLFLLQFTSAKTGKQLH